MDTVGLDDVNQLSGGAWPSRPWQGGDAFEISSSHTFAYCVWIMQLIRMTWLHNGAKICRYLYVGGEERHLADSEKKYHFSVTDSQQVMYITKFSYD